MKQLTCEMCGSTDLIKQDGLFVCQVCGCKYSAEEARKMMVEGTVDVSGSTVKVDTSARLKNLYTLARRARDDENFQEAAKYYQEIKVEDPNSWEAAFYSLSFSALDCTIGQIASAADSVSNSIATIAEMIQKYVPLEEQKAAYTDFLSSVCATGTLLFRAAKNSYDESTYNNAGSDFLSRSNACVRLIASAGIVAEEGFHDYELAKRLYGAGVSVLLALDVDEFIGTHGKIFQEKIAALQPKLREAYWKEHTDEKQKYDSRIQEIDSEIEQLKPQLRQYDVQITEIKKDLQQTIPAENQLVELKKHHSYLINQKSRLGLFAGRQKKVLQEQIDSLQSQINSKEDTVKRKKKIIQDDVAARVSAIEREKTPIREKISNLENERAAIVTELTKDR